MAGTTDGPGAAATRGAAATDRTTKASRSDGIWPGTGHEQQPVFVLGESRSFQDGDDFLPVSTERRKRARDEPIPARPHRSANGSVVRAPRNDRQTHPSKAVDEVLTALTLRVAAVFCHGKQSTALPGGKEAHALPFRVSAVVVRSMPA